MKIRILLTAVLFVLALTAFSQTPYKELKYPSLKPVRPPAIERTVLPNGMILYIVEDHELPVINLSARIGVGSIDEPAEKIGLADITGSVMRTGGTAKQSGDQLDEELESIAASVETGIGLTSGFASMSVLKENIGTGLEILADILMNPAFPQDKIELEKVEHQSVIARRNDNPGAVAGREFNKLIYGPESVYTRHPEYRTINAISREDLVAFHKKYFYPNNIMIGIWGDFKTNEVTQKINQYFGKWKKGAFRKPVSPAVNYNFDSQIAFVRKPEINQSHIYLGHIGGMANNPDYPALEVMNDILSGGFWSRLLRNVRTEQGLAYSVSGQFGSNFNYPGTFYAAAQTKSETTAKAIRSLLNEIQKLQQEEVSDEELALAKESYLNSYVFHFDTKAEVLNRLMTYEYYGYPKDFLEQTKAKIERVTKADILRVAKKYLHSDQVRILVVGQDKSFDEPLSTFGQIREIDVTIPD